MLGTLRIHGFEIIGYVKTETQESTGMTVECGIVTVDRGLEEKHRYVTGWYRDGDTEWCNGHYFTDRTSAIWDMTARAVGPMIEAYP